MTLNDRPPHARTTDAADGPLFTVVMPMHNRTRYVRAAVESVLAQTFKDWQLVVVDDASTDDSCQIVEDAIRGDARAALIRHPAQRGAGAARNSGMAAARGRWIACLDSDDRWFPDTLRAYADYIAGHPDARFIYGYAHSFDENGKVQKRRPAPTAGPTGTRELFEHIFLMPSASCHRRDLVALSGPYDETLPNAEDYDLYLRMSLHCRFEPLGKAVALRRRHSDNLSQPSGPTRLSEAAMLERFVEQHGPRLALEPGCVSRRLGRIYLSAARQFSQSGDIRQAREALARAHRYRKTFKSLFLAVCLTCRRTPPRADKPTSL
jgi:hypothetical protein